jgi:hypothetical protein
MTARLVFFLAIFVGIAVAPMAPVAGCAVAPVARVCADCCPANGHGCCGAANPHPAPLAPAGETSLDGKQLVQPSLIFLCLTSLPAAEPLAIQRLHAARLPALPLLDLNCIRLI